MFESVKHTGRIALLAAAMVASGTVWQSSAGAQDKKSDADGIIFERQQVMDQLDKDSEKLGNIAAGLEPPTDLAATAAAVAQDAKDSAASFKDKVPGGRSKPEVWSNNDDFTARMNHFVQKTGEMSDLAKTGNLAGVSSMLIDALPCQECHDVYRLPKKTG